MNSRILLGILIIIHIFLAFFKLGHTPMWDDEASVVWFAKNYNKYDKVVGYDGTNLFSYRNGSLINNELEYNNPPLDIIYTSYVIKYFGDDDVTVRASYVILGIIALFIYLLCLKLITKGDTKWFTYTAIILILSISYIMAERNARYYSLNFLFGALSLFATLKITTATSRLKEVLWLFAQVIFIYILFISHYLDGICWWAMCGFILLLYGKLKFSFKHSLNYVTIILYSILLVVIYSYIMDHRVFNRPDLVNSDSTFQKYFKLTGWFFNDLNRANIVPLWSVLFLIFLFFRRKKILSPDFKKMAYATILFLSLIYMLNPQNTSQSSCYEIRYLYIIFPILYLYAGYLLKLVHEKVKHGKYIAPFLLIIFVNTTLLSYIPVSTPPRTTLINFMIEKVQPYPTAYSETIAYINKNFDTRKKILTVPDFHNTVLLRYFSEKIEITNTLDSNTTHLSRSVIDSLGMNCLYIGKCKPDYVFLFGGRNDLSLYPIYDKYFTEYKYTDTIPVYAEWFDISRPEFFWHSFGPEKNIDLSYQALYILHN